jgi:hypothetical protein
MKRRLLLLVGTFAALLAAFLAYHFSAGGLERLMSASRTEDRERLLLPPPPPPTVNGRPSAGADANGLWIQRRDETGRLQATFDFPHWEKLDLGAYAVSEPNVVIYHKNGAKTYVRADRGQVEAEELARGRWELRNGELAGNVTIWHDPEPWAGPPNASRQRMRQIIRIHTDNLFLDNDRLLLQTNSRVVVFSEKADIYGKGLDMQWHDVPQELLRLTIPRGGQMFVYDVPADFGAALPGSAPRSAGSPGRAGTDGGAGEISASVPARRESAGAADILATLAGTRPASGPGGVLAPFTTSAGATVASSQKNQPARNIFKAKFNEGVHVDYLGSASAAARGGRGSIEGADWLAMVFEWDANTRVGAGGSAEDDRENRREQMAHAAAASQSASGPLAATSAASGPPATKRSQAAEPMVITWSGPLVVEPVGYTAAPSARHFDISAEGERMIVSDLKTQSLAACRRLHFAGPGGAGEMEGGAAAGNRQFVPVRLMLPNDMEVVCPKIAILGDANIATLQGAGYIIPRPALTREDRDAIVRLPAAIEPPPGFNLIRWSESGRVVLETDAKGGDSAKNMMIREADFRGQVAMLPIDANFFIRGGRVLVMLDHDANIGPYVRRATAWQAVRARLEGTRLAADHVTVDCQAPSQPAGAGKGQGLPFGQFDPTNILADGNVVVIDESVAEPVVARAAWLQGDLVAKKALLRGAPASVEQGPNRMEGSELDLRGDPDANRGDTRADVRGAGALHLLVTQDLNGTKLTKPRPLRLSWTRSMNYSALKNEAVLSGPVRLDSDAIAADETGQDSLICRDSMVVFFEKADANRASARGAARESRPASAVAASPSPGNRGASRAGRKNLSLNLQSFNDMRIARVDANGDVVMASIRMDANDRLLRRLWVTGPHLVYDPNQVRVMWQGMMLAEDYRAPTPDMLAQAAKRQGMGLTRPQQTTFWWDDSLSLALRDRSAVYEGNVVMVHHAGQYVDANGLRVPPWPQLKAGQAVRLSSRTLVATFAQADPNSAAGNMGVEGGPNMGELTLVNALGDVAVEEGVRKKRSAVGQCMEYRKYDDDPARTPIDRIRIFGSLPNQPKANAVLTIRDLDSGKQEPPVRSPTITWFMGSDRVIAENVSAGGRR